MKQDEEEKIVRLLRATAPGPSLEPDPGLPERIRTMARVRAAPPRRRRLIPVSLAAAAVLVAVATGGWIGYAAGTSASAGGGAEGAASENGIGVFLNAWSQAGFAEDWRQWDGDTER